MSASIYVLDFGTIVDNGKKVVFFAKADIASCLRMVRQTCIRVNSIKDESITMYTIDKSSNIIDICNKLDWKADVNIEKYLSEIIKDKSKVFFSTFNTPYDIERIIAKVPKSQTSQFMLVG